MPSYSKHRLTSYPTRQICVGVKRLQTSDKEFVAQSHLQAAREAQLSALEKAKLEQLNFLQVEQAKGKQREMGMQTGKREEVYAGDPYANINEALRRAHLEQLHRARKREF